MLMLLLLQNLIPNCTLDEKQPIEKLFRSGNGNTTIHSMIEWKLNPCHVKNGFQYMTTGFCARKARGGAGEGEDGSADKAAIDYFNYCIFYRQFNDNDLKNLPLSNGKERITYLGLRSYLQELEKKDFHVEVKIFDRKGDYQRFIGNYGLFESEWEIIRGINKTEGHVRTYFETNYRTTRKVVEDLLIEEIIEKSFYHKTGTDREDKGMADTLLELKDQLVLLSKKKNELHYYDRQAELLSEFAEKVGSLQGMYYKKQGLEDQLVKTYNTTLKRRVQKEQAHEALDEQAKQLLEERQETLRRIDIADIRKKELFLVQLQKNTREKETELAEVSTLLERKRARLEEHECDNYYLNYREYEKEFMAARKAVEEILSGSETLAEDLSALANELRDHVEKDRAELAGMIEALQEQIASAENETKRLAQEEKQISVKCEVLKNGAGKLEDEKTELQKRIQQLSAEENVLFFYDIQGQCEKAAADYRSLQKEAEQTEGLLEQCRRELYGGEMQSSACHKEAQRLNGELEALSKELQSHGKLQEQMKQLISIYGGTEQSLENILFQQQKELILIHQKNMEEKRLLQEKLTACRDGVFVPMPEAVTPFLEEIARYYDEKAVSGYEYLRRKDAGERELLLERYPMLPYAVVTSADLESIAGDRKFREKDGADTLVPIISLKVLEREKELCDEQGILFIGKTADEGKIRERLAKLEEIFAKQYERERILKADYDFVRMYLQECKGCEEKQNVYDAQRTYQKQLQQEAEEWSLKNRTLKEQEEELVRKQKEIAAALADGRKHVENMQEISRLEQQIEELSKELRLAGNRTAEVKEQLGELRIKETEAAEILDTLYHSLEGKRQELTRAMQSWESFKGYVSDRSYPACGMERKELEAAFLGKKTAYEQKNADISDKQKLAASFEKAMEQQKQQLCLLGYSMEELAVREKENGCVRTEMEQMLVLKKDAFEVQNRKIVLENEKKQLEEQLHRTLGSIQHARQTVEEKYGTLEYPEIPEEKLDAFAAQQRELLKTLERTKEEGEKKLRDLEEQCYALKAMAQDMERMMKSAGIMPENITDCLETGMSLKEQYESLRSEYEKIVREEVKRLEEFEKEKRLLVEALAKLGAYELSGEIENSLTAPENEARIKEELDSLREVTDCLALEKDRIGKDMDSLQELKDRFEAQCLQNCLNVREELERLQKLSRISMDGQMISMITLQVPYIREELYADAMSEYIDQIIRQVETLDSQAERLSFIRSRLAFKHLFSVIVSNMDAIRLTLYKRERMKEQSRYLKYEEAVGSTGQSQGIYIQFLVAIINYISSINSGNADPLELKKVIFIDNPFGAAKDIYIWEPIFKLLKANNVQLIVPARGATPAITGHFEVNYILGQKLIDGRQQTVVVDYRSQTEESGLEYSALEYEQETLQF